MLRAVDPNRIHPRDRARQAVADYKREPRVNIHDSHGRVLDVDRVERDSRPDYEVEYGPDSSSQKLLIAIILIVVSVVGLVKLALVISE
jgi:hypothetical protein